MKKEDSNDQSEAKICFHWIKNPGFRSIHISGAHGGITPQGLINVSFYTERLPIPTQTYHNIVEGNKLTEEIRSERVSKEGIIREIEFSSLMTLETAESIAEWLNKKVKDAKNLISTLEKEKGSTK